MLPIQVTIVGLRDTMGRFARAESVLLSERLKASKIFRSNYVALLKEYAPKKSGEFSKSLYGKVSIIGRNVDVNFYSKDPKAPYVIGPTKPHTITAVKAKTLRFWKGETKVFARSVFHPGTQESDFIGRAYFAGGDQFIRRMNLVAERVVVYLAGKGV